MAHRDAQVREHLESKASTEAAHSDAATAAFHEQVMLDVHGSTQGVSPGNEAPGVRKGLADRESGRESVDAAQAASFTRDLVSLSDAAPADSDDAELSLIEPEADLAAELEAATLEAVAAARRPARKETVLPGGDGAEEGGAASPASPPSPPDEPGAAAAPVPRAPRLRPRARVAWLGLEETLQAGRAAGILRDYQVSLLDPLIPRLTTPHWEDLTEALARCETLLGSAFVLKALAANRHPSELPGFAAALAELGESEALLRQEMRGPHPPCSPATGTEALRTHYDPIEALFPQAAPVRASDPAPWSRPRWLRGVPLPALELAIVAVHQALSCHLLPGEDTSSGAGDPLAAALEIHGTAHPSLARWFLALCARAEDHQGLCCMLETLRCAWIELGAAP